ncbi:MAG: RNA-directed DNA polymerase, partial [Acidobacteriaceae bacterium]|nr:RNA-directed DNA polymerase [Acidobacteriaceae bacterium]
MTSYSLKTNLFSTFLVTLLILSGDVELNPGPSSSLSFSCLNIRSATSVTLDLDKPACLQEFITDNSLDLLCLTETWLRTDSSPAVLNSLTPNNFSIISKPRSVGKGGGIAVIYKSSLQVVSSSFRSFSSFEVLVVKVSAGDFTFNLVTVYRPPSSSLSTFMDEFATFLVDVSSSTSELVICGDFNIHVDDSSSHYSQCFLNLLESFGLKQHVTQSTHSSNHTLDILISRSDSTLLSNCTVTDPHLSDHSAVCSYLNLPSHFRPPHRKFTFRNISKINLKLFSEDILSSDLYSIPATNLSEFFSRFNSTVTSILNKHAPLKSANCSTKQSQPFITAEIRQAKSLRSRLETVYRRTKSDTDKVNFKKQSRLVSNLITNSKRKYFRNLISDSKHNSKKLWSGLNSMLNRSSRSTLPSFSSGKTMASSFLKFFSDKVTVLYSKLNPDSASPHTLPVTNPLVFTHFSSVSEDDVKAAILSSSNSTCVLDVIPTKLLKSCLGVFLPPITTLINLCISESSVPTDFKSAIVTPLLKKTTLPKDDLANYRPVSNLNFISKILERVIYNQLMSHLNSFPSFCRFQSAYRKFHSVETALIRIQNDLLLSFERKQISALVLLDMSAAFDTVNHGILLDRLFLNFGIQSSALSFLRSYLSGRTQAVSVDSYLSDVSAITTGVPQGSVLGPLLFSLYTTPLSYLLDSSGLSYHLYADDTQLYISFKASDATSALNILSASLDNIHTWLSRNYLALNPSKTEFLLLGTYQQRSKLTLSSFSFSGVTVSCSSSVRNLGVIFDSDLSLKEHVSQVSKSCHYHIRQLRTVRPLLDHDSAVLLSNSLVSSKLDFCNSLYADLPKSTIHSLQLVQNSLARA